ncbi:MAG: hypothetical protein ABI574_07355, partial [Burkholderiales bacterium]
MAVKSKSQRGGFFLGTVVGLLVGLVLALGVAIYVTKVPIPFVDKVPQRTAEQDAAETEKNKHWDPNGPLASKAPLPPAASAASTAPAPVTAAPSTEPPKSAASAGTSGAAAA